MKELGHTTESTKITQKQTTKYTKVKKQVHPGAKRYSRCEEKLCKLIEKMCERSDSWKSGEINKIAENGNE